MSPPALRGRVVLASGNADKLREIAALLAGTGIEPVLQTELGIVAAEETGLSYIENAILKARHASAAAGLPAIADDSGLEVDALDGVPGILSARYAEGGDDANNQKLLQALRGVPQDRRTAHFHCAVACLRHAADPTPRIFEGRWSGRILEASRGGNGFGYDPVFWVPAHDRSAAELDPAEKNRISHRGQAMAKLAAALRCHR